MKSTGIVGILALMLVFMACEPKMDTPYAMGDTVVKDGVKIGIALGALFPGEVMSFYQLPSTSYGPATDLPWEWLEADMLPACAKTPWQVQADVKAIYSSPVIDGAANCPAGFDWAAMDPARYKFLQENLAAFNAALLREGYPKLRMKTSEGPTDRFWTNFTY
ncbi:MAG: hypothetical protein LBC84_09150, partial [Prevotellaceae bacterium]|nr:hypothetical protein [Prevotellaceae bacterium]